MTLFLETYGCQMNFADSEVVASILQKAGHTVVADIDSADFILINTCAIRDNAEQRIRHRLQELRALQQRRPRLRVGILGCMAERLQSQLMAEEDNVSLVVGPDAYRRLPELLAKVFDAINSSPKLGEVPEGRRSVSTPPTFVATDLSTTETYADIEPVRLASNGISAYISIMRGCQNYCAYCVVPYTRGRERSRDPETILREARTLFDQGYREVTLLGQNVNSYVWNSSLGNHTPSPLRGTPPILGGEPPRTCPQELASAHSSEVTAAASSSPKLGEVPEGRRSVSNPTPGPTSTTFPDLLAAVAEISPLLRVRFATSHPKDLSDDLLRVMAAYPNICRCIHLPVQSGSDRILRLMNRHYDSAWYLGRIDAIRRILPDCSITTDVIVGFCSETEEEFQATLDLFSRVRYDYAYMFKYSLRPNTYAARHLADDIPDDVKGRRLEQLIALQGRIALENNRLEVGRDYEVLVEGESHRSKEQLFGRNSQNKVIVFDRRDALPGQYRRVRVTSCTAATLLGDLI